LGKNGDETQRKKKKNGVEIRYANDTMLKDNLKLHESANQVCNVQDEEERVKTEKLCILFM